MNTQKTETSKQGREQKCSTVGAHKINWCSTMKEAKANKVVFLCSGNICRSPMGEALLKHAVAALPQNDPVKKLEICSAGTSTVDGIMPSANAIEALKRVGIDISDYRSTALTQKLLDESFAVFAMADSHVDCVKAYFKNPPKRLLRVLDLSETKKRNVADPYGGDLDEYLEARDDIAAAIPDILKYLQRETRADA